MIAIRSLTCSLSEISREVRDQCYPQPYEAWSALEAALQFWHQELEGEVCSLALFQVCLRARCVRQPHDSGRAVRLMLCERLLADRLAELWVRYRVRLLRDDRGCFLAAWANDSVTVGMLRKPVVLDPVPLSVPWMWPASEPERARRAAVRALAREDWHLRFNPPCETVVILSPLLTPVSRVYLVALAAWEVAHCRAGWRDDF